MVIRKDRKQFSIHAALAISFPKKILEPPLNNEINEIIICRCYKFIYSCDYSVPLPIPSPLVSDSGHSTNIKASSENVRIYFSAMLECILTIDHVLVSLSRFPRSSLTAPVEKGIVWRSPVPVTTITGSPGFNNPPNYAVQGQKCRCGFED